MKKFVFPLTLLCLLETSLHAQQTLFPNPINIGPGVTAVDAAFPLLVSGISRFTTVANFGDWYDATNYGKGLQICRVAGQPDNAYHLSFVRAGVAIAGMGYLQNSSTFAIQTTPNNAGSLGVFMATNGFTGINTPTPNQSLDVNGNVSVRGNYVFMNNSASSLFSDANNMALFTNGGYVFGNSANTITRAIINTNGSLSLYKNSPNSPVIALNTAGDSYFNSGAVCIGTTNANGYMLAVKGAIGATRLKVTQTWADFVFDSTYQLPSLEEVDAHVKAYKHLPGIPSEKEITEKGLDVGEMQQMQMQKIEELTLYMIELKKLIAEQRKELDALKKNLP